MPPVSSPSTSDKQSSGLQTRPRQCELEGFVALHAPRGSPGQRFPAAVGQFGFGFGVAVLYVPFFFLTRLFCVNFLIV